MKLAKLLLPCLLAFSCPAAAHATDNLALAYLFGYGGLNGARMQAYVPAPPYFAVHPPVYYGQRYARPYGASPYAAWPQLQPNGSYAPQPQAAYAAPPQCILNPYHVSAQADAAAETVLQAAPATPVEPLVIDNPYYQPPAVFTATP